jgi:ADP-ribose pyrophosphatase YjhB (NUDIX family)
MEVKKSKSAGGIIVNEYNEIIVVSQKGTSWSLPKGHLEENETELDGALREIYEETGVINLELVKLLGSYERYSMRDELELKTITLFLFRALKQELNPIDKDNPEAIWIHKDKVRELLTHPKDKEFFLKISEQI